MLVPLLIALLGATEPERIILNDLRTPAGTLSNGVLSVQLEARNGMWYPNGAEGLARPVAAFAEVGKALLNPGPLLRAPAGTEIHISLRNGLSEPMWVFGFGAERGVAADSFVIAPGATHEITFFATDPGVFYYAGKTTPAPLLARGGPDSQLNGAIVIDAPGAPVKDRIFMISWWFDVDSTTVSGLADGAVMAINGSSWPHTERVQAVQGEAERWRWINMTIVEHPLHLHGFYYSIDAKGDGVTYQSFAPAERRSTVTEVIEPGATMAMSWTPVRAGNWIMHCHFAGHVTSMDGLNKDRRHPGPHAKASHNEHYMEGLILGVNVAARGEQKASAAVARPIRLIARSKANVYGEYAGYGYAFGDAASGTFTVPGAALILEKDEPVAVNIVNETHESAAVHWHGIELESYPDGVAGFSGYGTALLPPIPAGDSLTIRFTPPRAGTFMYHSHLNEFQQIASGMYGPIIVLNPGETYDPATDKVFVFSDNGPTVNVMRGPYPSVLMNGTEKPEPLELKVGTTYRFRLINIRADFQAEIALLDGEKPVAWRMIARDGADLPAAQVAVVPAKMLFAPGQIYDVEFTPQQAGQLTFRFGYQPLDFPVPASNTMIVNVR